MHRADALDRVLVINTGSGNVRQSFEAGYNAAVKLTADRRILYVFHEPVNLSRRAGVVSAIAIDSGDVLWKTNIPSFPFGASATEGVWLSADEQHLYLVGSPDEQAFHAFVVDSQTGRIDHDFELTLPYPSTDMGFPRMWKVPWTESLVVASRDQLFTFDLRLGRQEPAISLAATVDLKRVPKDVPPMVFVQDGTLDPQSRQLFLAISSQEIVAVDLKAQPFTLTSVLRLPPEWRFGGQGIVLLHPGQRTMYIQVKRDRTPAVKGPEVDEIWAFDQASWVQSTRWQLADLMTSSHGEDSWDANRINYGLALGHDGQTMYALLPTGLLWLNRDSHGQPIGIHLRIATLSSSLLRYAMLQ